MVNYLKMKSGACLILLAICCCTAKRSVRRPLNTFVRHFETLDYDLTDFHSRVRRSTASSPFAITDLHFKAFGKPFHIRLRRDHSIFTGDYKILNGQGKPIKFDPSVFVEGDVLGKGNHGSYVNGVVKRGRFEGKIRAGRDMYYVESASRYFGSKRNFHSVMYRDKDIVYDIKFADKHARVKQKPTSFEKNSARDRLEKREKEEDHHERVRRGVKNRHKNTCHIKLVADHKFTRRYMNHENAIVQLVLHYKAAEYVFRNQTFNMTKPADRFYNPEGVGFRVGLIIVYDGYNIPRNMRPEHVSVNNLLEIFSQQDHSDMCLAYLFTDRSFDNGVMGLAWIGYAQGQAGGICDKYANFNGKLRSYNTGLVSFRLYGRESPPAVTEITFVHELGHSWGSQHDPPECLGKTGPNGKGHYIMYDRATSGYKTNNRYFSKCSIDAMVPVINAKGLDPKYGCFKDVSYSICGNAVVEYPEQCDCGTVSTCRERCCTPYGIGKTPCILKDNAYQCSPSRGPCCNNETCGIYRIGYRCREPTDCRETSVCDGRSFLCPKSAPKRNLSECALRKKVCLGGYCTGSPCLMFDLEGCMCNDHKEQCDLCCMYNGKCTSSYKLPRLAHVDKTDHKVLEGTKVAAGTPCNQFKGYCDGLGVCQAINLDGPLQALYRQWFTYEGVTEWLAKYWFMVTICTFLLVALMFSFVFFCQRYTPSNNPAREIRYPTKPLPGRRRRHQPVPRGGQQRGQQRGNTLSGTPLV